MHADVANTHTYTHKHIYPTAIPFTDHKLCFPVCKRRMDGGWGGWCSFASGGCRCCCYLSCHILVSAHCCRIAVSAFARTCRHRRSGRRCVVRMKSGPAAVGSTPVARRLFHSHARVRTCECATRALVMMINISVRVCWVVRAQPGFGRRCACTSVREGFTR